jgi:hypothetical protein
MPTAQFIVNRRSAIVAWPTDASRRTVDKHGPALPQSAGRHRASVRPGSMERSAVGWLWLAVGAYAMGCLVCVIKMMTRHPDRHFIPGALAGLAWPYFAVLGCIALCRRKKTSQW